MLEPTFSGRLSQISKRSLTIALLIQSFAKNRGGAERYVVELALELSKNHVVHVFTQSIGEHPLQNITIHKIPQFLKKPRWINQLWFAAATWYATRKNDFDIVHSHEMVWVGNVQSVHVLPVRYSLFSKCHGISRLMKFLKVIFSVRLLSYLMLEYARFVFSSDGQRRRAIIVPSPVLKKQLLSQYPHLSGHIHTIQPGICKVYGPTSQAQCKQARKKLSLLEEGQCILFVANDFQRKGLPTLLKAVSLLPDDFYLAVVGSDQSHFDYLTYTKELNLSHRVFFLGNLINMEVAYQSASCLAHPTLEDTFAMAVLEAFSYGLPVVVSDKNYCGISALLTSRCEALLLTDPRDHSALASGIVELLNPTFTSQLISNALSFAAPYLWENIAMQHEVVYFALQDEASFSRWGSSKNH